MASVFLFFALFFDAENKNVAFFQKNVAFLLQTYGFISYFCQKYHF